MRHGVDLLLVMGEADRTHGPARARAFERAVVEAAAIAQAPTAAVEGQQWHDQDVWLQGCLVGLGLGDAPYAAIHGMAGRPGAEDERFALALHHRHGEAKALPVEPTQQRPDAKLVSQGRKPGDDTALRRGPQEIEPLPRHRLPRPCPDLAA